MMNKWSKRIGYFLVALVLLLISALHLVNHVMSYSDNEIHESFIESGIDIDVVYTEVENHSIRLVAEKKNGGDSILIVFVHGAPGSWDAFKEYMSDSELTAGARLISYDRPGYGNSSNTPLPNIIHQASILNSIIDEYRLPKVLVIGHSYGGPIAGYASAIEQYKIDRAVIIAPLLDPYSEPIFWYSYFAHWTLTKWVLPKGFQTAGAEKFSHSKYLREIEGLWSKTKTPVMYIHGMQDGLAPAEANIIFAKRQIPSDLLELHTFENKGHLILWTDFISTRDLILESKKKL